MEVTDLGAGLHLVNRSCHHLVTLRDEIIIVRNLEHHQGEARGMMRWEKHSFKFLAPRFLNILSRPSSLVALTSLLSPSIMVKLTQLNTWSILTRGWLLGSKILGLNVLELQFVMLANHDQNVLVFVLDLLKVRLYVKLKSSVLQDLLCKSA